MKRGCESRAAPGGGVRKPAVREGGVRNRAARVIKPAVRERDVTNRAARVIKPAVREGSVRNRAARAGFTMAELMVTIAIISILGAVAIPAGMGMRASSRQLQLNRAAETIYMSAQRSLIAAKLSGLELPPNENGIITVTNSTDTGNTTDTGDTMVNPKVFVCPAVKTGSGDNEKWIIGASELYNGHWRIKYNTDWTMISVYYSETEEVENWEDDDCVNWHTTESNKGTVGWYGEAPSAT